VLSRVRLVKEKKMKTPADFNFNKKTVLIRCDFNVSIDHEGKPLDDLRIRESVPTIEKVINDGGRAVIISHAGEKKSLKEIVPFLEKTFSKKIIFIKELGDLMEKAIRRSDYGDILLLENLRLFEGETVNSNFFAGELALLADFYINEAFSVSHRKHASMVALPSILPSCAGFRLTREVAVLSKVRDNPWHPMVTIIGGAKVASKIRVVKSFLKNSDHLLLGGKVANEILVVKGICHNRPWPDEETVNEIKNVEITSPKIHLPVDLVVSPYSCDNCVRIDSPADLKSDEGIYDIGPETIKIFTKIISEAKMMIWAGPLGLFEDKRYERGTREIAKAMALNHRAFKVVGGGDTGIAINKFNVKDSIDHISTGGGAMLEFMAGTELPGLRALGYYGKD
jgi:phosphoglycerate kinase